MRNVYDALRSRLALHLSMTFLLLFITGVASQIGNSFPGGSLLVSFLLNMPLMFGFMIVAHHAVNHSHTGASMYFNGFHHFGKAVGITFFTGLRQLGYLMLIIIPFFGYLIYKFNELTPTGFEGQLANFMNHFESTGMIPNDPDVMVVLESYLSLVPIFFMGIFSVWIASLFFYYRYALAPFLYLDGSNLNSWELITESKTRMNGHKLNLFKYQISQLWKPYAFISLIYVVIALLVYSQVPDLLNTIEMGQDEELFGHFILLFLGVAFVSLFALPFYLYNQIALPTSVALYYREHIQSEPETTTE